MTVRAVPFGSPEYDATVELRRDVLRRPLGLDFTREQLDAEHGDVHLALFEEDRLLACLMLTPIDPTTLQMRQVAVREDLQGQGLGRRLVEEAEAWAEGRAFERMVLHARETAVAFYVSLGYVAEGEAFEEVGIPHRAMGKSLRRSLSSAP